MKILFVPYDFSLPSKNALRYAIDASGQLHAAQIVVFHHNPQVYTNGEFPVLYMDNLGKINEDLLAYFLRENGVSTGSAQGNGIDHAKVAFDELCKGSV